MDKIGKTDNLIFSLSPDSGVEAGLLQTVDQFLRIADMIRIFWPVSAVTWRVLEVLLQKRNELCGRSGNIGG